MPGYAAQRGTRIKVKRASRSAGRRAFFLTFSIITQRDPFRRDRRGATGLEVVLGEVPVDAAGEQCRRGGKISADQARALCGDERAVHSAVAGS